MDLKHGFLIALCLTTCAPATGEAPRPIVFKLLNDEVQAGSIKVFRGVKADEDQWRDVIVADFDTLNRNADYCTGTLVGDEAVLTARHCLVDAQGRLRPMVVRIGNHDWTVTCMTSAKAVQDRSYDYALCRMKRPTGAPPLPGNIYFDSIDTTPLTKTSPVLLVGYGCETMSVAADGTIVPGPRTRAFRIGDEKIAKAIPNTPALFIDSLADEPALCPGDSGGPLMFGATAAHQSADRSIRAINYGVAKGIAPARFQSIATSLADPTFAQLLADWKAVNQGALICQVGVNAGSGKCR